MKFLSRRLSPALFSGLVISISLLPLALGQAAATGGSGQAPGAIPGMPFPAPTRHEPDAELAARRAAMFTRGIYLSFLENGAALNQVAAKQDAKGKNGDYYRTIDQKAAGLNDAEGIVLNEVALDYKQRADEVDARTKAAIEAHRAGSPTPPKNPLTMAEFTEFASEKDAVVDDCIERLKSQLGDADFAKLDTYIRSLYKVAEVKR
jgi:hypothetical protein